MGSVLATGDSLTFIWRTQLGGIFNKRAVSTVTAIYERLRDIEFVLMNINMVFSESHTGLLRRALNGGLVDIREEQSLMHYLNLADDTITAEGKYDFVVGDSATVFFQVDRADAPGFALEPLADADKKILSAKLKSINKDRDEELKNFVLNRYNSSNVLSKTDLKNVPFSDVPFEESIGNDYLDARGENIMAIGDFALIGLVETDQDADDIQSKKSSRDKFRISKKKNHLSMITSQAS
mmetsp:Transcript_19038/g.27961  ORF Transcript_19038/g.27961 Transcript_19038/m.27961 type:complete len:238 (+) Transcript_19038:2-715(+)